MTISNQAGIILEIYKIIMKITKDTINKVYKAGQSTIETMELQGFELIETFFVDSSGFGLESEPALTRSTFEKKLSTLLDEYGELTAKITGVGMFQVYVSLFKRVRRGIIKRISTNVFERKEGDKRIIRLYDTDIVTLHKDYIVLNTGGYSTRTTHKWMNEYLPKGYVHSKRFESYYNDGTKDIKIADSLKIQL